MPGRSRRSIQYFALQRFVQISTDGYRRLFENGVGRTTAFEKSARHATEAFEKILASGAECNMLQTDKGTEFLNSTFQSMLKRHNIHVGKRRHQSCRDRKI